MTQAITKVISALGEMIMLLNKCGERKWSKWLQRDHDSLCNGNLQALEHLLSAYGGMGSLNDIYLCPENKHTIQASEVAAVNEKFSTLSSQVYSLAQSIDRNAKN